MAVAHGLLPPVDVAPAQSQQDNERLCFY